MDNPMQPASHAHNHHNHVFDPALNHLPHNPSPNHTPMTGVEEAQPQDTNQNGSTEATNITPGLNADGTPIKRRPGRPKGSTKKNLLAGSPLPPKIKRPVGRPRKDGFPAGSVGPRVKRERTAAQQGVPVVQYGTTLTGVGYPPVPYGFSLSAPMPAAAPMFQIDPSLERASGGDNDANAAHPIALLHPQNVLAPSSPAYFSLTASATTARTPSEHRFLYWDPQPLVFNGIQCPSCSAPLLNKGRISTGPVKIYDIEKPFFIVGCEYVCRSPVCIAATSPDGRKFASTDSSILRSLPMLLKDEFPARLLHGDADAGSGPNVWNWKAMGVSTGLWNLVMGALKAGLKKDVILRLIWSVQHKVPETLGEPSAQGPSQMTPDQEHDQDDKMDDDNGEDDGDNDEHEEVAASVVPVPSQSQTLSSTNFTDAYGDAWKENTAMTDSQPKPTSGPSAASAPTSGAQPTPTPAAAQAQQAPSSASAAAAQQPTMMPAATAYNPYTAYPFTPYAYVPHHLVNGQMVPLNVGQVSPPHPGQSPQNPAVSPSAPGAVSASVTNGGGAGGGNGVDAGGAGAGAGAGAMITGSHSKRSPRHCCKCGSQECKGKGGRSFCMNGCQDCGKLECKGRNSRRPDKKCTEGWT
ncbi:hypothetical protein BDZ97DRAFT_1761005 [Flammula alnicola]|nr:hypothetical protein BDZ97DRAFT_1761005 [Flammula alnicola]